MRKIGRYKGTSAGILPQASSRPRVWDCLVMAPKKVYYFYLYNVILTQPCLYSVVFGSMIKFKHHITFDQGRLNSLSTMLKFNSL